MLKKIIISFVLVVTFSSYVWANLSYESDNRSFLSPDFSFESANLSSESAFSGLGSLLLHSTKNKKFKAVIAVNNSDTDDPIRVSLGSAVDFYRYNVKLSKSISSLSLNIFNRTDNGFSILISSDSPLHDDEVGFVVKLYVGEEKKYGVYKFFQPAAYHLKTVSYLVCNRLGWNKDEPCVKKSETFSGQDVVNPRSSTGVSDGVE